MKDKEPVYTVSESEIKALVGYLIALFSIIFLLAVFPVFWWVLGTVLGLFGIGPVTFPQAIAVCLFLGFTSYYLGSVFKKES